MTAKFPLPSPYEGNTPQDHIDALTDHADLRLDGPLLDYLAMAAADLIGRQQAEIAELTEKLRDAEQRGRSRAANAVRSMPGYLGDEGWNALADKADEAGYDRRLVLRRRKPEDSFTALTIEAAYQYGYRTAAEVALRSGGAQ